MDTQAIISDIEQLPEDLQKEVAHYVATLKNEYEERKLHNPQLPRRVFGLNKGKYNFDIDFDEPIEGFEPYM